ncbi:MAG: NTP transferase domain-containing protein [Marinilabiliaceae bacterium]|nr:NTP transferase domain-containing protein [Marinilabiliaceae bacterium]
MNAMIFAAGLGTRLAPYTNHTPKALININGKPLIWYALNNVIKAGATRIIVNTHHFADQLEEYISKISTSFNQAEILISNEHNTLLDTGGGLLNAQNLFRKNEPILIHNADILTNASLSGLISCFRESNSLATLMIDNRNTNRYLLFDNQNILSGWINSKTTEQIISRESTYYNKYAFNGIQIVSYSILDMLGEIKPFSIISSYLKLAKKHSITGWKQWEGQWFDVGTPEKLNNATNNFIY